MDRDVELSPIIQARAFEFAIVDAVERLHQVQRASGRGALREAAGGLMFGDLGSTSAMWSGAPRARVEQTADALVRLHVHDARISA